MVAHPYHRNPKSIINQSLLPHIYKSTHVMSNMPPALERINRATGLSLTPSELELIFSMQDTDQNKQYENDLHTAIIIYEDAQQHNGQTTESARSLWPEINKRIAFWSYLASLAKPEKSGLSGKRRIPIAKRLMLKNTLSPSCALIQSGALE